MTSSEQPNRRWQFFPAGLLLIALTQFFITVRALFFGTNADTVSRIYIEQELYIKTDQQTIKCCALQSALTRTSG